MKKFYLSKCRAGSNTEINHVFCKTKQQAIDYFNRYCTVFHESIRLDSTGYAKQNDTTYVVSEPFAIGT